ncbi:MAG: HAD family hydrolase [Lachnospiraceae bacterium]|nr:HAD family hydrolase [Lachnospiraceae bacterium]
MEKNSCTSCTGERRTKSIAEYDLVLVDMDGTLYYQRPLQLTMGVRMLLNAVSAKEGVSELLTVLRFRKMREKVMGQQDVDGTLYQGLALRQKMSEEQVEQIIQKWIYRLPLDHIPRFRDEILFRLVGELEASKTPVVIWSDYPTEEKQKVLGLAGIPGCYNGGDEIAALKPSPAGIFYLMEKYGVEDAKQVLVIGDRLSKDGKAAKTAETDFIILKKHPWQRKRQYKKLL